MATFCHVLQATNYHSIRGIVGNMLQSKAKAAIRAHLRAASGGTDTQQFRVRVAKKSGVGARTIGTMMSDEGGNPTLSNIEAVAEAIGLTPAEFLSMPGRDHQQTSEYQLNQLQAEYNSSDGSTKELVGLLLEASNSKTLDKDTSAALLVLARKLVHAKPLTDQTKLRNHLQNRDK